MDPTRFRRKSLSEPLPEVQDEFLVTFHSDPSSSTKERVAMLLQCLEDVYIIGIKTGAAFPIHVQLSFGADQASLDVLCGDVEPIRDGVRNDHGDLVTVQGSEHVH